jgi:hypothetical protein
MARQYWAQQIASRRMKLYEFTTSALPGDRRVALLLLPRLEIAVVEHDGADPVNRRDLGGAAPKRAVLHLDHAEIRVLDLQRNRVGAIERDKFAVGDQQAIRGAFINLDGYFARIAPNPRKLPFAYPDFDRRK